MIYVAAASDGIKLKTEVIEELDRLKIEYVDLSNEEDNFYEASMKVVNQVLDTNNKGIIIDSTGVGPFMVAAKHKGIICAELNDEQSALMTRDHNNTNIITLGQDIIGKQVVSGIVERFVTHDYAGGRHQIRVDMLNSML